MLFCYLSYSDYDKVIILLYMWYYKESLKLRRVKKKTQGFVLNGKFALLVALIARGYHSKKQCI